MVASQNHFSCQELKALFVMKSKITMSKHDSSILLVMYN